MARIDDCFRKLIGVGATELLICSDRPPLYRAANELLPLPGEGVLLDAELRDGLQGLMHADDWQTLQDEQSAAFATELDGGLRVSGLCHMARHGLTVRLRLMGAFDLAQVELALPAAFEQVLAAETGLLIVTGAVGSGKTTWIAHVLSELAAQRTVHIATCENPVEYLLPSVNGPISQRSVGRHCSSLAEGIDAAFEANAEVVTCSELNAAGVFERMVEAACAGVLAVGELRGHGTVNALELLLPAATSGHRTQLAYDLSESLLAVVSLDLLPKKAGGRVLAAELLMATPNVCSLVRDGKMQMLHALLERESGMQSMDRCLLELATRGVVEGREAYVRATDKRMFAAWA